MVKSQNKFYEFFAGGGMARAGLGQHWECLFSNDFDHKKSKTYLTNWGSNEFITEDIRNLTVNDLPGRADLAWASFPCQDLSLAGGGAGLRGERSGTFWPFWKLMQSLLAERRAPSLIVLENVCGTLTSHNGQDFSTICEAFEHAGYRFGAVVIDAALFVPQSRPRLFIIGVKDDCFVPEDLMSSGATAQWCPRALRTAYNKLSITAKEKWIWWRLPVPPPSELRFADLIENDPTNVTWHSSTETEQLLAMMSTVNLAKVEYAKCSGRKMVGTVYRRTRVNEMGDKVQRAEVRFDDIAGCLRTPAGGSSRQLILVVDGQKVQSRLISTRETARLMGLPDSYKLPETYNEAYHLTGDGVVVPVVRHLSEHILEELLLAIKHGFQKIA